MKWYCWTFIHADNDLFLYTCRQWPARIFSKYFLCFFQFCFKYSNSKPIALVTMPDAPNVRRKTANGQRCYAHDNGSGRPHRCSKLAEWVQGCSRTGTGRAGDEEWAGWGGSQQQRHAQDPIHHFEPNHISLLWHTPDLLHSWHGSKKTQRQGLAKSIQVYYLWLAVLSPSPPQTWDAARTSWVQQRQNQKWWGIGLGCEQ